MNLQGVFTFSPFPLPPELTLSPSLMRRIDVVANVLGRLDGTAKALPDRKILVRSFVRREAQLSSYIENTCASYDDVAVAEAGRIRGEIAGLVRETLNAERAINAGIEAVFEHGWPVKLQLIRQIHGILLKTCAVTNPAGNFGRCRCSSGVPAMKSFARKYVDAFNAGDADAVRKTFF